MLFILISKPRKLVNGESRRHSKLLQFYKEVAAKQVTKREVRSLGNGHRFLISTPRQWQAVTNKQTSPDVKMVQSGPDISWQLKH